MTKVNGLIISVHRANLLITGPTMNPEDHWDRTQFTEVEWLNIRLAAAGKQDEWQAVYNDALDLNSRGEHEDSVQLLTICAVASGYLGEIERCGQLFLKLMAESQDEQRSGTLSLIVGFLDDLIDTLGIEFPNEILNHQTDPIEEANFLFHLAQIVDPEKLVRIERLDDIIHGFFDAAGVEETVDISSFMKFSEQFFEDRKRWNRASKAERAGSPEIFETEYWRNFSYRQRNQ